MMDITCEEIRRQAAQAAEELLEAAKLEEGSLFVVGCSSSEITGGKIGKASSLEAAQAVFDGVYPLLQARGVFLAAQCCEHLNRALVLGLSLLNITDPTRQAGTSNAGCCLHK